MRRSKRTAATNLVQPLTKKARSSSHQQTPNLSFDDAIQDDEIDITARNARESPLLRLPGELRVRIWEIAFGRRTIHPRGNGEQNWQNRPRSSQKWAITSFDPCEELFSEGEVYEMSLQGEADAAPNHWKHPKMKTYWPPLKRHNFEGLHICARWQPRDLVRDECLVPIISKQIYNEAIPAAWKSITWSFMHSGNFEHFLKSPHTRLDLVTQLSIIQYSTGGGAYQDSWTKAMASRAMSGLTSLRGLNFIIRNHTYRDPSHFHPGCDTRPSTVDIINNPPYYCQQLPSIIRRFQRFRLEKSRTTVLVTGNYWEHQADDMKTPFPVSQRREMAEAVRTQLLQRKEEKGKTQPKWARNTEGTRRSARILAQKGTST
ncbi:hypothetical protein P153DRAFT_96916 [Dothidotthia symphoricarpi CBS 119687]|uniref:Uncharacterized protein n=1 Tax=Dothidotthia symphoricarpi CBS 119687 TaxID=1392245 RepID=A0A6A6AR87_9PLEO|nr:uncharacterized protein P153DRAFT_96916 [Dothidotthia symphoricarpi CBS 119687]KAF2133688.1 hypothetical protein P153DRAFT_96916 [Dothidotthia symphoricarpi CBS 119687]